MSRVGSNNTGNIENRQETLEIDDETGTPRRINSDGCNNVDRRASTNAHSPESGIELESRSTELPLSHYPSDLKEQWDGEEEGDDVATPNTVPPNEMFTFDLTDPDEVLHMLDNVDLTDEDTDVLLDEAYKVNKALKQILKKQMEGGDSLTAQEKAILQGAHVMIPGTSSSRHASRAGSAKQPNQEQLPHKDSHSVFTAKNPLPPISDQKPASFENTARNPSVVYSAKLRRPVPQHLTVPSRNVLSSNNPGRGELARAGLMPNKQQNTKKRPSLKASERPPWNDRFIHE